MLTASRFVERPAFRRRGPFALSLVVLGLAASSVAGPPSSSESFAEVVYLLRADVPAEAVRAYVETHNLRFALSAEEVVILKEAGADGELLTFLLERSAPVGPPVDSAEAEVVYEAEGFRAFRQKDARGREVLVLTNLDENGRRMDRPPNLTAEVAPAEASPTAAAQVERAEPPDDDLDRAAGLLPPTRDSEPPPYFPVPPERRPSPAGMIYVGPFYQFPPANVPGPGSPWSPVFQVVPTFGFWGWPVGVPVYPFAQLAPVYPPGLSYSYRCARWR